jgi:hypothetical protein
MVERVRASWLEKEEDRLVLGDGPGDWGVGGVYGIRTVVVRYLKIQKLN